MASRVRWGILGCGKIARKFAAGLASAEGAELVAAGSRTKENADLFAGEFSVPRRHGSYEALATDPEVDAVYVATPHPMHSEHSILCLEAGKAVLCEKPFAVNAAQTRAAVEVARRKGVFLMEAMWSRFVPSLVRVRELIADGAIGEVTLLHADFGFRAAVNPESRLFDLNLGGGGLLDVGIYIVSLASMVFGAQPNRIKAMAELGETGADERTSMIFGYPTGAQALLSTAIQTRTPHEATIMGTDGHIRLHAAWWSGSDITLVRSGQKDELIQLSKRGNGYNYEAEEVGRCLSAGKTESEVMPLDETVAVMETMDRVRAEIGLRYPMED